jgi:hypothetical protein
MRRVAASLSAVVLTVLVAAPIAAAQDAPPDSAPRDQLAVLDAHIEGSGPWTSWFGGAPDRTLVLVVENRSSDPVVVPELVLTSGRGADPADPLPAPDLGRLEAGQSTIVRVDLDLPSFAIGTYAVEGSFDGVEPPLRFRAETSHIPWVLVVLPTLVLAQLALIWIRNRVRNRIHRPSPRTSDPTLPDRVPATTAPPLEIIDLTDEPATADDDLETIVRQELDVVFDEAFRRHDEELDELQLTELVVELARTAARRVSDRTDVSADERVELHGTMTEALLAAFDLAPPTRV